MADYYKHIKDEKLKKLIRIQRIIMWIPLLGSVAAIGMMQYVLYKKHPEKLSKFDMAFIAIMIGLIGLFFLMKYAFSKILPNGADALIYITALVLVTYFAAYLGVQDEIKTVYELQEGIIKLTSEEDPKKKSGGAAEKMSQSKADRKAETARTRELKRELESAKKTLAAQKARAAAVTAEDAAESDKLERETVLPPVEEQQALVARMIREDAEKTLAAKLPKAKNIAGHEDQILRSLKVYMTRERIRALSSAGAAMDFSLLWIVKDERARRTEVLYSRPVLRPGYTCYFSLTVKRGEDKNGMLFKLSEITRSRFPFMGQRKYYQAEEIVKTIAQYLE